MVRLHHLDPRATDFVNNLYYVFHNANLVNTSLSAGVGQSTKGAVNMEAAGTYSSSENWQLYFQQGRYFIRNYDYGGQWQLGLTEDSPAIPKLMKRSGALGQQWTMERQDDGTFKFHNGLLGNSSSLALAKGNKQPAMQSADSGSRWEILPNPSAQAPKDTTMMLDNKDFEVAEASSSPVPSATSSSSTSLPSATSSSTSTPTSSSTTNTNPGLNSNSNPSPTDGALSNGSKSSSLAPGAIAGVAVGIVLILALVAFIGYFLWARRRPKDPGMPTAELGGTPKVAYYAQIGYPQDGNTYPQHGVPAQPAPPPVRYELDNLPMEKRSNVTTQRVA